MSAWAVLLGTYDVGPDHRRPHRGMLPDVIFDTPRPPRLSLFERMMGLIGALRAYRRPASAPDPLTAGLGEREPVTYIDEARAERAENSARDANDTRAA